MVCRTSGSAGITGSIEITILVRIQTTVKNVTLVGMYHALRISSVTSWIPGFITSGNGMLVKLPVLTFSIIIVGISEPSK